MSSIADSRAETFMVGATRGAQPIEWLDLHESRVFLASVPSASQNLTRSTKSLSSECFTPTSECRIGDRSCSSQEACKARGEVADASFSANPRRRRPWRRRSSRCKCNDVLERAELPHTATPIFHLPMGCMRWFPTMVVLASTTACKCCIVLSCCLMPGQAVRPYTTHTGSRSAARLNDMHSTHVQRA